MTENNQQNNQQAPAASPGFNSLFERELIIQINTIRWIAYLFFKAFVLLIVGKHADLSYVPGSEKIPELLKKTQHVLDVLDPKPTEGTKN